jgi:hypothetical protein
MLCYVFSWQQLGFSSTLPSAPLPAPPPPEVTDTTSGNKTEPPKKLPKKAPGNNCSRHGSPLQKGKHLK